MFERIKNELLNVGLKFMSVDEKIVRMFLETSPSHVNEIVIVPTVKRVMKKLVNKLDNMNKHGLIYNGLLNGVKVSIIRCHIGSPHMAILLECLKRTKAKKILRIDFCGAIINLENKITIGDTVIPKTAYCGDGTTSQYLLKYPQLGNMLNKIKNPILQFQKLMGANKEIYISQPSYELEEILLKQGKLLFPHRVKNADLWTTDALFCETTEFLNSLKLINIETIDMESSILFLLGRQYAIRVASILGVSDLPGTEYDLFTSNTLHPDMELGIKNAIRILIKSLPLINRI